MRQSEYSIPSLSPVVQAIPQRLTAYRDDDTVQSASDKPGPEMYFFIFATWLICLVWFHPRMWSLMDMAQSLPEKLVLISFILFIDFAWLYGLYNIGVIVFAIYFKIRHASAYTSKALSNVYLKPHVAILYTTCNDFVDESVQSCIEQDYPFYTVYLLDDSTDDAYKKQVDAFAARHPDKIVVVRRPDRKAFKAGNLNYALRNVVTTEPYFAIADADEILPPDFLSKLVPVMESDPHCGFAQANHQANKKSESSLSQALGIGIDIHWKWYQPLRNKYGFVMFLGHGALLRRRTWEEIGGFPDIVSEDLGFAIHAREKGYRGKFVSDVMCQEDFPDTVRAFRIRHMKWTRGTCEFLARKAGYLLRAKNITWTEKLDILFPTMNLPLTLLYLLFMVNANLFLPYFFGAHTELTMVVGGQEMHLPIITLDPGFRAIFSTDFFIITMLTFFAPVLSFIIELAAKPVKLFRFLSHSTALYAALSPLSSIGVLSFLASGKAIFLVTGDKSQSGGDTVKKEKTSLRERVKDLLIKSHPDQRLVQTIEIVVGCLFLITCVVMVQISFAGLCLAFLLLPVLHHVPWETKWLRPLVYVPFILILLGVGLAGMSLFGMQAVFFGYGFHF